ncbi:hypothetical protein D1BOALGB6SA_8268 [Olavius sp. associated proteobacterium Delta 1]|nr:hypothetical protein D1BOALGB6SA_8268 [Olavius sp. associated proteobacterium Delta 1]
MFICVMGCLSHKPYYFSTKCNPKVPDIPPLQRRIFDRHCSINFRRRMSEAN